MSNPGCFCRGLFLLLLTGLSLTHSVSAGKLLVLKGHFVFSAISGVAPSSIRVRTTHDATGYRLSLVPDFDVRHNVVVLALVLRRLDDRDDATNLLDPTGRTHGYQAYIFAASDFVHGARQSLHGAARTLTLDRLGLEFRVDIAGVSVAPIPGSSGDAPRYCFDGLAVGIDVEELGAGADK